MASAEDDTERFWRAVHEVFDPIVPVTDPALRAEREARYNPMVELDRRLRLCPVSDKSRTARTEPRQM